MHEPSIRCIPRTTEIPFSLWLPARFREQWKLWRWAHWPPRRCPKRLRARFAGLRGSRVILARPIITRNHTRLAVQAGGPEHVRFSVIVRVAGQHEKQIGQPIQVMSNGGIA